METDYGQYAGWRRPCFSGLRGVGSHGTAFVPWAFIAVYEPTVNSNTELTVATCCASPPISDAG